MQFLMLEIMVYDDLVNSVYLSTLFCGTQIICCNHSFLGHLVTTCHLTVSYVNIMYQVYQCAQDSKQKPMNRMIQNPNGCKTIE